MLKKIALILLLVLPMSVFAQKFGHVKTQEILTAMPEYTKAQTDIQTMQKQYEDEMKRVSDEFTKKYTAYQQEQANLPKNIQERRQNELQELSERGMQMQQDSQQQLQQSWMQMLEPIAKKIDDAIKAVGQEGGYVYIFDLNATQIPFVNESLSTDVTGAVKAKLGIQ
ncbi:MAG: OmpH family outer membrane protein [Bacteroides sp.]|nr:OmpH family outer membrane protein [Bacteroides sp.]